MTSAASAICGTHFGDTKLVASIDGTPASASASISATLTSVGTTPFSFCRPSRGPTSTMRTRAGSAMSVSLRTVDDAADRLAALERAHLRDDLRDRVRDARDGRHVR